MTQTGQEPQYEVSRKGSPIGTYPLHELSGLIVAGTLLWTDDCWTEGMESWIKLSDIRLQIEAAAPATITPGSSNLALWSGAAAATVVIACLIAFFAFSGGSETEETPGQPATAPATASHSPRQTATRKNLGQIQLQVSGLIASSFVETRSASTGLTTYAHRYYNNVGNRVTLRVFVDSSGKRHLYTFYSGKTWIFHNQLRFEFDKKSLESETVPAHKASREIGESNSVTESCHFSTEQDTKLVGKLAQASSAQIMMTMLGRRPVEKSLSFETMVAIRESFQLAELLEKRRTLLEELAATP
jgi:hypothetical protein